MANIKKRFPENVSGDFFVDSTCINCDTCRQLAPRTFGETGEFAFVQRQPESNIERRAALRALVSCPTGSIGSLGDDSPAEAQADFPLAVEEPAFYCGFNSPKSFGGNSYFVRHPAGNWLIDSPKYLPRLVERLEALGGVANIFLTHSDDVADAARYAERFRSRRFIHREELSSQPGAEAILEGNEPVELAPGFLAIPTPGHTAGHCCLLALGRFLFTGDHLAFDRSEMRLTAYRDYCWCSWTDQVDSMRRLADYDFEWILPGHGQRVHLDAASMRCEMADLVERMQEQS